MSEISEQTVTAEDITKDLSDKDGRDLVERDSV